MHFVNVTSPARDNVAEPQAIVSVILILGYGAIILNAIANFMNAYLLGRKINHQTPKWLLMVNFIFLLAEIAYFSLT